MKTHYKFFSQYRCGLLALAILTAANVSFAQAANDRLSTQKTQAQQDRQEMSDARAKRKEVFSKRHDMKDPKARAEVVRQLKEADDKLRTAVHRRAKTRGLETEGDKPNGGRFRLVDFDEDGNPLYEETQNINAAITTAADVVRDSPTYQTRTQVEAELAYTSNYSGIQEETCSDIGGGQNASHIDNGDWTEYTIDVPLAGEYWFEVRAASNSSGGTINLSANSSSIGSLTVPGTGGWQSWTSVGTYVTFATAGSQTLRMDFAGGSGSLFNVNWFTFGNKITIGLWEVSGIPRLTHQEFDGRITVIDGSTTTSNHASHVAGTLIAQGINPLTQGMAPRGYISAFSSSSDEAEMAANGAAAPNTDDLYLSNHSYGVTRGWKEIDGVWNFLGTFSDDGDQTNDYEDDFGRYNSNAEEWDDIAYDLPYYLIFKSAGNQRTGSTPSNGETWTNSWNNYVYDDTQHPLANNDYKDGWDNMEGKSLSKNLMSVGNSQDGVDGNGDRDTGSAQPNSGSSRGPADDGRIKPDIYGNGTGLRSPISSSDTATASYSGTSMSSPNVCGSAALLIDSYRTLFPSEDMRASTLKALILHTADDRGTAGPDYKHGWGIMNTQTAADVIQLHADDNGGAHMLEALVNDTTTTSQTHSFAWDGTTPLRVTICWTDPASDDISGHDNRTKALVNDLNLTVTGPGGPHLPYVMPFVGDWSIASIDDAATTGVNDVDNVEQVYLSSPAAGTYTITVNYLGSLTDNEQNYSLIVTGHNVVEPEPEIEVEENGPLDVALTSGGTAQDFGSTAPSDPTVVKNYTIRNTGAGSLTNLAITKSGSHPPDFTVSSLSVTELLTGETTNFSVSYDPLDQGTRSAQLNIASNDSDENPFVINLTAFGLSDPLAAEIEIKADGPPVVALTSGGITQDFGRTVPSDPTVTKNYTIRNTGDALLSGLAITKSGSHPSDFTASSLSATELLTGETANFSVSYDPLDQGTRTAQLNIASNDSDENPFVINLTAYAYSEMQEWRLEYFGNISVRGNRGDDADYDLDGITNLIEFAMATDPTTSNTAPVTFTDNANTIDLTYDRNVDAMVDYDFQVEWNNDLTNAAGWFDTGVTELIQSDDGSVQSVKATAPKDSATQRFFQLSITPK